MWNYCIVLVLIICGVFAYNEKDIIIQKNESRTLRMESNDPLFGNIEVLSGGILLIDDFVPFYVTNELVVAADAVLVIHETEINAINITINKSQKYKELDKSRSWNGNNFRTLRFQQGIIWMPLTKSVDIKFGINLVELKYDINHPILMQQRVAVKGQEIVFCTINDVVSANTFHINCSWIPNIAEIYEIGLIIPTKRSSLTTKRRLNALKAEEEEWEIRFGFANPVNGEIESTALKAQLKLLYPDDEETIGEKNYNIFTDRAQKALVAADGAIAYKDANGNQQKPQPLVKNYGWNANELLVLMEYTGSSSAARNIREYWQFDPPYIQIPTVAHVLYDALHKPRRVQEFFVDGFTTYFGISDIDIPIVIDGQNKFAGDTLAGITLHGPWSTSHDHQIAMDSTYCPGYRNPLAGEGYEWYTSGKWVVEEVSIVFKIEVPAGVITDATDSLGIAPVEQLSWHSREKEWLTMDVDGKYVTILEVCYHEDEISQKTHIPTQEEKDRGARGVFQHAIARFLFESLTMHMAQVCPKTISLDGPPWVFECTGRYSMSVLMNCKCTEKTKKKKKMSFSLNAGKHERFLKRKQKAELDTITGITIRLKHGMSRYIPDPKDPRKKAFLKYFAKQSKLVYTSKAAKFQEIINTQKLRLGLHYAQQIEENIYDISAESHENARDQQKSYFEKENKQQNRIGGGHLFAHRNDAYFHGEQEYEYSLLNIILFVVDIEFVLVLFVIGIICCGVIMFAAFLFESWEPNDGEKWDKVKQICGDTL